jgi:hypothetical protein
LEEYCKVNSDTKQAYVDNFNQFKIICDTFPNFLEYIETTMLASVEEKFLRMAMLIRIAMHIYRFYHNGIWFRFDILNPALFNVCISTFCYGTGRLEII